MDNILLIDPVFIKSTTNISDNLADKYLQSAIREATDVDLEEIFGTKLLEKVKNLVGNGDIKKAVNIKYKNLLNKSQYFLAYSAISRVIIISAVKIDNFGISQANDEHIQNIEMSDIYHLEKYYRNKADYYKLKVQQYLEEHYTDYPELLDCNMYGIESNTRTAASTSIFLGGARGKISRGSRKTYGYDYE